MSKVVISDDEDWLECPTCASRYLHHGRVTLYDRKEDAEQVLWTEIEGHELKQDLMMSVDSENPSSRRHGMVIDFWCENCDKVHALTIAQHKGCTEIRWRE